MQLRDKRAKSPPTQDSIPRRRASRDHFSRKEFADPAKQRQQCGTSQFSWKIQAARQGNLWTTWSQDPSTIPLYILDALAHNPKSRADMRHTIHEISALYVRAGAHTKRSALYVRNALRVELR
jgi:hypothetical protein